MRRRRVVPIPQRSLDVLRANESERRRLLYESQGIIRSVLAELALAPEANVSIDVAAGVLRLSYPADAKKEVGR